MLIITLEESVGSLFSALLGNYDKRGRVDGIMRLIPTYNAPTEKTNRFIMDQPFVLNGWNL